mgnify:FL=1
MDIVIRVSENDSKVWRVYRLTEICGGGYNIKITVLFHNMLVPQNNILEIPKTVRESSGESVFSEDFFYLSREDSHLFQVVSDSST